MRGKAIAVTVLLFFLAFGAGSALGAFQGPQTPLPGSALQLFQFVDELPRIDEGMELATGTNLTITMCEFQANMMPTGFVPATPCALVPGGPEVNDPACYTGTYVWGYIPGVTCPTTTRSTYINPVVVATRHVPTKIKFVNELPDGDATETAWGTWVDDTLHWADTGGAIEAAPWAGNGNTDTIYNGPVPAVVHLHGGEVPPVLDGGPDAWFTNTGTPMGGHGYWTYDFEAGDQGDTPPGNYAEYNYPNSQEAAPIWFHDHALGVTRINVYAGMAGAYLLLDPYNAWPFDPNMIIPLVIQDRMFDTNGQLYFPNVGINTQHPKWVPEFEGDVIVVNGKAWPKLTVSNNAYVFWFLNGSNARTYNMFLTDMVSGCAGPPIWVIGTDGGLLDAPVKLDPTAAANNSLTMMPGERYLAVIDFTGYDAQSATVCGKKKTYSGQFLLKNNAKTPFPAGVAPDGNTTGRVMQFAVLTDARIGNEVDPAFLGDALRPGNPIEKLADPVAGVPLVAIDKTRLLTLNEVMGAGGPLAAIVNNTMWNGKRPSGEVVNGGSAPFDADTFYTEFPKEGETELWEIVNLTADAHPIHLHLVQFQLMNRQKFNVNKYGGVYAAAFVNSTGETDPMTGLPYPNGVYIPEFGPPLAYDPVANTQSGGKWGGNPDVTPYLQGFQAVRPEEMGWKDTVIMYPGQVTRIMVRWAPTDLAANTPAEDAFFPFDPNGGHGYVWHCHIIDHEDNEMMRPTSVINNPKCIGDPPAVNCYTFTDY